MVPSCGISANDDNCSVTMPESLPQEEPLDAAWLGELVSRALTEDLGGDPGRDVTTQAIIDRAAVVTGEIVARRAGVLAGLPVVAEVLSQVAARWGLETPWVTPLMADGDRLAPGDVIAEIAGSGHVVLTAERTILNLMSHASGVATHTRMWADALEGTGTRVLDTRKTMPTLREVEKYAVRCGGGVNKRMGLYDVALIKDNHILAVGGVAAAIAAVRDAFPDVAIQVEVERMSEAREALEAGARFLMLDNMPESAMREVVEYVRGVEGEMGKVEIEATGGLTLERARMVAEIGVDYMSVGALTHSSPSLDLALDLH
jgi:nicotinate-nucleotide pyrophosphorylase (carboxylating)